MTSERSKSVTLRRLAAFVSVLCVGTPLCSPAQAQGKKPIPDQASSYVPLYTFQLDKDHRTEYPMASSQYNGPLRQCTEDGTVFVEFFMPSDFSTGILFAFGPHGKKTAYPFDEIHDLYDVGDKLSIDTTDAVVSFLSRGTRDSTTKFPTPGKTPRYTGEHNWYIVRFDRDGNYKDSIPIDIPHFNPANIAQFDTGQYLVLGFDSLDLVPKVAMVDADGTLRQFLDPPKPLPINSHLVDPGLNPSVPKERFHSFQVFMAVFNYQLTHHGSAIELLEPGSDGPILEVFPDGSMNAIPIQPHPGYELNALIPSNGKTLFVRFRPAGDNALKPGQGIIEEIAVADGTPLKRISFPGLHLWDILCIHDGNAEILREPKTSTASSTPAGIFEIYTANLVPAKANAAQ
jgi:hypothetical protein